MPDSRVYSDPRPFDIFFYHKSTYAGDGTDTPGWRLALGPDSGRVKTERTGLALTP
jgi:hypothetical protein